MEWRFLLLLSYGQAERSGEMAAIEKSTLLHSQIPRREGLPLCRGPHGEAREAVTRQSEQAEVGAGALTVVSSGRNP